MNHRHLLLLSFLWALPTAAFAEGKHKKRHHRQHMEQGDADAMLNRIKDKYPEKYERLLELREEDPRAFRERMRSLRHHMMKKKASPEERAHRERMRELRDEFRDLAEAVRDADEKEGARLHGKLKAVAAEMFELKQEGRRARLEGARKRIIELEAEIEDREENREEIIEQFIEDHLDQGPRGL